MPLNTSLMSMLNLHRGRVQSDVVVFLSFLKKIFKRGCRSATAAGSDRPSSGATVKRQQVWSREEHSVMVKQQKRPLVCQTAL